MVIDERTSTSSFFFSFLGLLTFISLKGARILARRPGLFGLSSFLVSVVSAAA